jgi:hypothetical protein
MRADAKTRIRVGGRAVRGSAGNQVPHQRNGVVAPTAEHERSVVRSHVALFAIAFLMTGCAAANESGRAPETSPVVFIEPTSREPTPSAGAKRKTVRSPACDISGQWAGSGDDEVETWTWEATFTQRRSRVRGSIRWSTSSGDVAIEHVEGQVSCGPPNFELYGTAIESESDYFITGDYKGTFDQDSLEGQWTVGQPGRFWGKRERSKAP